MLLQFNTCLEYIDALLNGVYQHIHNGKHKKIAAIVPETVSNAVLGINAAVTREITDILSNRGPSVDLSNFCLVQLHPKWMFGA